MFQRWLLYFKNFYFAYFYFGVSLPSICFPFGKASAVRVGLFATIFLLGIASRKKDFRFYPLRSRELKTLAKMLTNIVIFFGFKKFEAVSYQHPKSYKNKNYFLIKNAKNFLVVRKIMNGFFSS